MKISLAISTLRALVAIPLLVEGGGFAILGIIIIIFYVIFFFLRLKYFIEPADHLDK